MANVLTVVWFLIAYVVTNTSILVWAALMLPNPVERARLKLERKPVASFFVGAAVWAVTIVVASALLKEGSAAPLQLLGWMTAGPMLASSVVGGAAFANVLAVRLRPQMKSDSPLLALLGGALCTTLSGLLPVVGWVVFLPLVGFMSVGAGVMGLFRLPRRARRPQPAPTEPSRQPGLDPTFVLPDA